MPTALILILHSVFLLITGYFEIDLLSDDYLNFISAQSSDLSGKFSSSIPFYTGYHFRPLWFLSIDLSIYINSILNLSKGNFVFFRIENMFLFYSFAAVSSYFLFRLTGNRIITVIYAVMILIYPLNLNSICWTAGKADLLCGIFLFLNFIFSLNYSGKKRFYSLFAAVFFFIMALLTKETAVTIPLLFLIILWGLFGSGEVLKSKKIFLWEFAVLLIYFAFKIFGLKNFPAEVVNRYQDQEFLSFIIVLLKAFISLIIPFDYLTLQYGLQTGNLTLYVYLALIIAVVSITAFSFFKINQSKFIPYLIFLFSVAVLPNLVAGYFRPQLVLIPFTVFFVFLNAVFFKIRKTALLQKILFTVIFVFWIILGYSNIKDWKYASDTSGRIMKDMCKSIEEISNNERIIILGLPSRYKLASILDYASGPYNYHCKEGFSSHEIISDAIHTGALDKQSLESELKIKPVSENEFEISTTGETQYLLKLDLLENVYRDSTIEITFSGKNSFNKPEKAYIKILSHNTAIYFFNNEKFNKFVIQ